MQCVCNFPKLIRFISSRATLELCPRLGGPSTHALTFELSCPWLNVRLLFCVVQQGRQTRQWVIVIVVWCDKYFDGERQRPVREQ